MLELEDSLSALEELDCDSPEEAELALELDEELAADDALDDAPPDEQPNNAKQNTKAAIAITAVFPIFFTLSPRVSSLPLLAQWRRFIL